MEWLRAIMAKLGFNLRLSKHERKEAEIRNIMRGGLSDIYDARLKLMALREDLRKLRIESEELLEKNTPTTIHQDKDHNGQ
jgi:hypothetical protein